MISLQQLRRSFLTISLAVVLATAIAFGFGSTDSWAATSFSQLISQPQSQIATMNRAEAMTKNAEGKAQEAIGNMTGDLKGQMMGKAKQVESQNRNLKQAESQARKAAEDMKDKINLKEKAKAATKKIEDSLN